MIRRARLVLVVAALFVVQGCLIYRFSYRFLRVDLLLLTAAFLALEANPSGALGGAFGLGLLRDLGSLGRLGTSALLLLPATALILVVRGYLMRESLLTDVVLTGLYLLGFGVVTALCVAVAGTGTLEALLPRALGQAAFSTALSPLLFLALMKLEVVQKRGQP